MKYTLYYEGEFLVKDELFLDTLTPGVFEARGVFETMCVDDGRVFLLDRHLQRLRNGCRALKIRLPFTSKQLQTVVARVVMFNQFKNGRLRMMVYRRNRSVELAVLIVPRTVLSEQNYFHGYHLTPVKCDIPASSRRANVKSLDYGCYLKAYREARAKGFNEALLINSRGYVIEASRSNVFYITDDTVWTPGLNLGCLDGITRRVVIDCAKDLKLPVKTVSPKLPDLLQGDEVFITNALLGVMPVTRIGQSVIAAGRVGDWTYKLRSRYLKKRPALSK